MTATSESRYPSRRRRTFTQASRYKAVTKLILRIQQKKQRSKIESLLLRKKLDAVLNQVQAGRRPTRSRASKHVEGREMQNLTAPEGNIDGNSSMSLFNHDDLEPCVASGREGSSSASGLRLSIVKPYSTPQAACQTSTGARIHIIKPYMITDTPKQIIERSPAYELPSTTLLPIDNQPYCTHACILGLAHGWKEETDPTCPNAHLHGIIHISREAFLLRLKEQFEAEDQDFTSYAHPPNRMFIKKVGKDGKLCKIRLESHGYTLVAKSRPKESSSAKYCVWESYVYDEWLQSIQGKHIPVSPGVLNVRTQQGEFTELLMSYGGLSAFELGHSRPRIGSGLHEIFRELHKLKVKQNEVRLSNILFDDERNMMIVDFFSSMIYDHEDTMSEETRREFAKERQAVGALIKNQHRSSRRGSPVL